MQDYYGRVCGSLMYRGAGVLWEVMLAGEILSRVRAIPFVIFFIAMAFMKPYTGFYPPFSLFFTPTGGTRLHFMPLFILPFPVFSHPQGESSSIHKISSTIYKPNHMMYNQIYLQGRV